MGIFYYIHTSLHTFFVCLVPQPNARVNLRISEYDKGSKFLMKQEVSRSEITMETQENWGALKTPVKSMVFRKPDQ
jgi:hypothetical protein